MKRHTTKYPGVTYRLAERIGGPGLEKVYYIRFTRGDEVIEEKAGRQFADDMTPARANNIRGELIEGRRKLKRELRAERKKTANTLNALWTAYCEANPRNKGLRFEKAKWKRNVESGIGKKEPSALVPLDIDRLRLGLQKEGKATTAARVLELLRRAINFGVKRNLIEPVKIRIGIPKQNNQVTEDLTTEQIAMLLKALDADIDQWSANIVRLALFTGMRKGEVLSLAWDDVDFERGFITIRDPKGGRDQAIPLNARAREVLEDHPRDPESPWVFPGRKAGEHATDAKKAINRIRKAAALPKGFRPLHGLRHVYASTLASSGKVDMFTLQKLLTHKSPAMTQRYAHLRDDALRRASELAGELLTPKPADQEGAA